MPLSASECLLHQVRQRDEALRERSRAARALNALHAEKRELQWALGDLNGTRRCSEHMHARELQWALGDLRTSPLRAWESPSTASFASSHSAILGNQPASFGRTSTPSAVASAYAHAANAVLGSACYSYGGSVGASRGAGDVLGVCRGAAGASAAATATTTTAREATSSKPNTAREATSSKPNTAREATSTQPNTAREATSAQPNWRAETSLAFSEGHVVLRSPGDLGSEQQLTSRDNAEVAKHVLSEAFATTPSTPKKSFILGDGEAEAPLE